MNLAKEKVAVTNHWEEHSNLNISTYHLKVETITVVVFTKENRDQMPLFSTSLLKEMTFKVQVSSLLKSFPLVISADNLANFTCFKKVAASCKEVNLALFQRMSITNNKPLIVINLIRIQNLDNKPNK